MLSVMQALETRRHFNAVWGTVFHDANDNGVLDAGEQRLPEVFVILQAGAGSSVLATDANGVFSFPSSHASGPATLVAVENGDWLNARPPLQTVVGPGEPDVGNLLLPMHYDPISAEGVVFHDLNRNGIRDAGEPGMPNITVFSDDDHDGVTGWWEAATTTDSNGLFQSTFIPPMSAPHPQSAPWEVRITPILPDGWKISTTPAAPEFEIGRGIPRHTDLAIGIHPDGAIVTARVFIDTNGDGVRGVDEPLYNKAIPLAFGARGMDVQPDGSYALVRTAGEHALTLTSYVTARYTVTTAPLPATIEIVEGVDLDLGEIGLLLNPTHITGIFTEDTNRSHAADDGDAPLVGLSVYIDQNDNGVLDTGERTVLTDADGRFIFSDVLPDTLYIVRAVVAEGTEYIASASLGHNVYAEAGLTIQRDFLLIPPGNIADSPTSDFNADGIPDLIVRDEVTGDYSIWLMNLQQRPTAVTLPTPGEGWIVGGSGDFSGDGHPDIAWHHAATGQVRIVEMDGTAPGTTLLDNLVGTEWRVVGVGDFNHDGKSDLLFRHTAGHATAWLMDGTTRTAYGILPWVSNPDWQIISVADLNDDGHTDLLWWNQATKHISRWTMNNVAVTQFKGMPAPNNPRVSFMGVFHANRDGVPDLLWHQPSPWDWPPSTYSAVAWIMTDTPQPNPEYVRLLLPNKPL